MAVKLNHQGRFWSRLHFFVRLVGLLGFVAVVVGLVVGGLNDLFPSGGSISTLPALQAALSGDFAPYQTFSAVLRIVTALIVVGGLFAVLVLLVEALNILFFVAGRRSVVGFNAVFQVALAVILLIAVNVYSSGLHVDIPAWGVHWHVDGHYARIDTTNDHRFTLPDDIKHDLARLQGSTKIVVYLSHKNFGQSLDKPDPYFFAAERKVVEKVEDTVNQFAELGPRFQVVVLDVADVGFQAKLEAETKNTPALREAIDGTAENTIFFEANGKVQRLGFNDFCPLDKKDSLADKGGNLVLRPQGYAPFARRILNVDEKKPRIGIVVIHRELSTAGLRDDIGLTGLKKALQNRGFEVRDIVMKKWDASFRPSPAAYTADESKYETNTDRIKTLARAIEEGEKERRTYQESKDFWASASLEELTKRFARRLGVAAVSEGIRRVQVEAFTERCEILTEDLDEARKKREKLEQETAGLPVDNIGEKRRLTDLKAKLDREFADCDLLLVPRLTLMNVGREVWIQQWFYPLNDVQTDAIRDFLKAGKPVLACLGPANLPDDDQPPPWASPDKLEDVFTSLGFQLGKQTILHNAEAPLLSARQPDALGEEKVRLPPARFDWPATALLPFGLVDPNAERLPPANPIRRAMQVVANSAPAALEDLEIWDPRPIGFDGEKVNQMAFNPVFLMTDAASWNEDKPFRTDKYVPEYRPAKGETIQSRSIEPRRRGPFPIGLAVETVVPASWSKESPTSPTKVRVAVIGQGGFFAGTDLKPAREALMVNTLNWLLGRDDLLPRDDLPTWRYPRVALTEREQAAWTYGAIFGLPGLFAFLGVVVLLYRQLR
jgi:hypothetical protein